MTTASFTFPWAFSGSIMPPLVFCRKRAKKSSGYSSIGLYRFSSNSFNKNTVQKRLEASQCCLKEKWSKEKRQISNTTISVSSFSSKSWCNFHVGPEKVDMRRLAVRQQRSMRRGFQKSRSDHVDSYIREKRTRCCFILQSSLRSSIMYRTASLYRPVSRAVSKLQSRSYAKEIAFGENARSSMLTGVETLARAVSATLGPKVCTDTELLYIVFSFYRDVMSS